MLRAVDGFGFFLSLTVLVSAWFGVCQEHSSPATANTPIAQIFRGKRVTALKDKWVFLAATNSRDFLLHYFFYP